MKRKAIRLSLMTGLLLGAAQAQPGTTLQIPTEVTPPTSGTRAPNSIKQSLSFTPTPDMPRCVPSAFQAPGQAWNVDFTTGGLTLTASDYGAAAQEPNFQGLFGVRLADLPASRGTVELFIVDHFSPVRIDVRAAPDGPVTSVNIRHGALVEAHIRAILESAGFVYVGQSAGVGQSGGLVYRGGTEKTILIKRVDIDTQVQPVQSRAGVRQPVPDTALVSSEDLANSLSRLFTASSLVRSPAESAPLTILNLSFALLPCEIMKPFRTIQRVWAQADPPLRYTLNAFLNDVARASHLPLDRVSTLLTEVPASDPLNLYLTTKLAVSGAERRLAVASSGNYGLPFSTAPGSGPGVLAVGAKTWGMQSVAKAADPASDWSDSADTYSVGEWFRLPYQQMLNYCQRGGTCISDDLTSQGQLFQDFAYRGTSFSAPNITAFLALRLDTASPCFESNPERPGFKPLNKAQFGQAGPDFYGDWLKQECP